jgi:hypothetical protein
MRGIIRLLPLSIVLVTSCEHRFGYVITGHLTGFPDSTMVYLQYIKRTIEMKGASATNWSSLSSMSFTRSNACSPVFR